jgi:hypothetical protein
MLENTESKKLTYGTDKLAQLAQQISKELKNIVKGHGSGSSLSKLARDSVLT